MVQADAIPPAPSKGISAALCNALNAAGRPSSGPILALGAIQPPGASLAMEKPSPPVSPLHDPAGGRQGCYLKGSRGSHRTPSHLVEGPSDPLQIGNAA
jgi:hypothetical protein